MRCRQIVVLGNPLAQSPVGARTRTRYAGAMACRMNEHPPPMNQRSEGKRCRGHMRVQNPLNVGNQRCGVGVCRKGVAWSGNAVRRFQLAEAWSRKGSATTKPGTVKPNPGGGNATSPTTSGVPCVPPGLHPPSVFTHQQQTIKGMCRQAARQLLQLPANVTVTTKWPICR